MKKRTLLVLSVLILTGCSKQVEPLTGYVDAIIAEGRIVPPFNTMIQCVAYDKDVLDELMLYVDGYSKTLHQDADRKYEYTNVNNVFTINKNYGGEPIEIDTFLWEMLEISIEMCELTEGYFNPVIGSLVDLWESKFTAYGFEDNDPSVDDINKALTTIPSYQNIREIIKLDRENRTVQFNKVENAQINPQITLSGIAKGYYIDCLESIDCFSKTHRVSAGSSSCSFAGKNPVQEDKNWHIGLKHPDYGSTAVYAVLNLSGSNVLSTSGDSENYFINQDGIKRHHILNPYTGYSENYYRYITLASESHAAVLDALSTALFNISSEQEMIRIVKKVEDFYGISINLLYTEGEKDSLNVSYRIVDDMAITPTIKYIKNYREIPEYEN